MSWSYFLQISTLAGINALVALGLYPCVITGQLSVTHAALAGIGGYAAGILATRVEWPLALTIVAGGAVAAGVAAWISAIVSRMHGLYLAIATLGLGESLVVLANNIAITGGPAGLSGIPLKANVGSVLLTLSAVLYCFHRLEHSRLGQAMRAVGYDETAAQAVGISPGRIRVFAFAFGGFLSGMGGALFAHYVGIVEPSDLSFIREVNLYLYLGVGGLTTPWGAVVGAFMLTYLAEVLRFSLYGRFLLFGLLLAVIMVIRPSGLVSRRSLRRSIPGSVNNSLSGVAGGTASWRSWLDLWRKRK